MSDKFRERAIFSDSSSDEDEEYYNAPLITLPRVEERVEEHKSQETWTASQPAPEGIQTQPDQSYKIPRKGAAASSDEQPAGAGGAKRRSPRNVSKPRYVPEIILADTPDSGTMSSITNTTSRKQNQNRNESRSNLVQQREADLQPLKRKLVNAAPPSSTGDVAPKSSTSDLIPPKETVAASARVSLSPAPHNKSRTTGAAKRSNSKNVISSLEALAPPPSDTVNAVTEAGIAANKKSSSPKVGGEKQIVEDDDDSVIVLSVRKSETKPPLKKRKMEPTSIMAAGVVGESKDDITNTSAVVEPAATKSIKKNDTVVTAASAKESVNKKEKPKKKARKKKAASKFAVNDDEGVYFIEDELFIVDDEAPPPRKKRRFKTPVSEENGKENQKPSDTTSSVKPKKTPAVDKTASKKAPIEQQEKPKSNQGATNKSTKAKKQNAAPADTEKDLPKPAASVKDGATKEKRAPPAAHTVEAPAKSKKKNRAASESSAPVVETPNQQATSKNKNEGKANPFPPPPPDAVKQPAKSTKTDSTKMQPSLIQKEKSNDATSSIAASSKKKEVLTPKDGKPSAPAVVVKKKKKRSFQDQVVCAMLFSCKVYNLKTLAQACQTTETVLQHLLLSLLDKKVVLQKEFASKSGKSKVLYWANQDSKAKEVMKLIPDAAEMQQAQQDLAALHKLNADNVKEMAILTQGLSNDEIEAQLLETEAATKESKEQLAAVRTRIQNFKNSGATSRPMIGSNRFQKPKSAAQLDKERCPRRTKIRINAMRGEWKSRKQKCMDFVDQMADGMEKKPKQVVQLLDLETDEMEGITEMPPKHIID
jgi:hypothetical protein